MSLQRKNFIIRVSILGTFIFCSHLCAQAQAQTAKDNGDIYMVNEDEFTTGQSTTHSNMAAVDFEAVKAYCNESFSIPMDYFVTFNTTGELPDTNDKTGMCFLRCYFERSGLLENWRLNENLIRDYIWPATGDSIEYCQHQGQSEMNACVRVYQIAKCLMIRAIVDARNKPTVKK